MSNTSLQRLRPKPDEMFTFEAEDFMTRVNDDLPYASMKDCLKAIDTLTASLFSKLKDFVNTWDKCKAVSLERTSGVFRLTVDRLERAEGCLTIDSYWHRYLEDALKACKRVGVDGTFAPTSFDEAVGYFVHLISNDVHLRKEIGYCGTIRLLSLPSATLRSSFPATNARDTIRLTTSNAHKFLSFPDVYTYLSPWLRVLWRILGNGLSIEEAYPFAVISKGFYTGALERPGENWEFKRNELRGNDGQYISQETASEG